jgi:hypothetical protein
MSVACPESEAAAKKRAIHASIVKGMRLGEDSDKNVHALHQCLIVRWAGPGEAKFRQVSGNCRKGAALGSACCYTIAIAPTPTRQCIFHSSNIPTRPQSRF